MCKRPLCWGRSKARKRKREKVMEGKRAKAKMQRILKANKQEIMRLREMSRRRERMMARMKAKWLNNEEEGGSSNLPIVDDLQEMLAEVISKVVEEDEGKQGGLAEQ